MALKPLTHLIISRVNLEMTLDGFKYDNTQPWKDEKWHEDRVKLLNDYARASLRKQTCQDFTFISLWQQGKITPGNRLPNEFMLDISHTGTEDDKPLDYHALLTEKEGKKTLNFSDQIASKVSKFYKAPVLITNLDCDDALHKDFVEKLQTEVRERNFDRSQPFYFSTSTRFCYNIKTQAKGKKVTQNPSPFVSTWEPEIRCYPLRYNHQYLGDWVKGVNIEGLYGMQTVNDSNIFSKGTGNNADFDLSDYI